MIRKRGFKMLSFETKFFGKCELEETEIITFQHGIPGFEDYRRYVILKYREGSPFNILQAVDEANLALIILPLEEVVPGYSIDLSEEIVSELKLAQPEDAVVVAVVTIPTDISKATVNLAAPIVINHQERLGRQIILDNPAYALHHPLFLELKTELTEKTEALSSEVLIK